MSAIKFTGHQILLELTSAEANAEIFKNNKILFLFFFSEPATPIGFTEEVVNENCQIN